MKHIHQTLIILYVESQQLSTAFYEGIFRQKANLKVPGMTEFLISDTCKIGLMPNNGIAKILGNSTPHPQTGMGIPRCELYLYVKNLPEEYDNALKNGAKLVSPISERSWNDTACYFSDPDGHIIAFATNNE